MLAHVAGFYVYFAFRLHEIKVQMRAELKNYPEEKLQRLFMTVHQYQQGKNDEGELEWEGYMYDIARVIPQGDHCYVLALRDEAETDLVAFLHKIIDTSGKDTKAPPQALTQFLSLVFTVPNTFTMLKAFHDENKKYSAQQEALFYSIAPDVIAPPPRA